MADDPVSKGLVEDVVGEMDDSSLFEFMYNEMQVLDQQDEDESSEAAALKHTNDKEEAKEVTIKKECEESHSSSWLPAHVENDTEADCQEVLVKKEDLAERVLSTNTAAKPTTAGATDEPKVKKEASSFEVTSSVGSFPTSADSKSGADKERADGNVVSSTSSEKKGGKQEVMEYEDNSDVLQVDAYAQNELDIDLLESLKTDSQNEDSVNEDDSSVPKPREERVDSSVANQMSSGAEDGKSSEKKADPKPTTSSKSDPMVKSSSDKHSNNKQGHSSQSTLWISGLPNSTKATDLKDLFGKYGKVIITKILASSKDSESRCYGCITMSSREEAASCIKHLNNYKFQGNHTIKVTRKLPNPSGNNTGKDKVSGEKRKSETSKESDSKKDANKRKIVEKRPLRVHSLRHKGSTRTSVRSRHAPSGTHSHGTSHGNKEKEVTRSGHRSKPEAHKSPRSVSRGKDKAKEASSTSGDDKGDKVKKEEKIGQHGKEDSVKKEKKPMEDNKEEKDQKGKDDHHGKEPIVPFGIMKAKKMEEWERIKKRREILMRYRQKQLDMEIQKHRVIQMKQRNEAKRLALERDSLRRERNQLENDRADIHRRERLRLEQFERERLESERASRLRIEQFRMEEERERRVLKRLLDRKQEVELEAKRPALANPSRERYREQESRRVDDRVSSSSREARNYAERRVERYDKRDSFHQDRDVERHQGRESRRDERPERYREVSREQPKAIAHEKHRDRSPHFVGQRDRKGSAVEAANHPRQDWNSSNGATNRSVGQRANVSRNSSYTSSSQGGVGGRVNASHVPLSHTNRRY